MNSALLSALDNKFADGDYGYIDSMLVIRNGTVVFERSYTHDYRAISGELGRPGGMYNYYDPDWHPYYKDSSLHTMQSATKSIAATAVGIAIARHELPGVHAGIAAYFSAYRPYGFDEAKQKIKLADLLTMRAGIKWDEWSHPYTDSRNSCGQMEHSEDWIGYVVSQPMASEPGEEFVYNSGVSQMLSHIVKEATGDSIDDYLQRHLFGPLGIDYYWKRTPTGLPDTEGGLYLTPRGLAKIGYLYLHDGIWDGERLLPEGWVAEATHAHVENIQSRGFEYGYGYQWWSLRTPNTDEPRVYAARGYGGQFLYVVPENDLIVVFTGWNIFETGILAPGVLYDFVLKSIEAN